MKVILATPDTIIDVDFLFRLPLPVGFRCGTVLDYVPDLVGRYAAFLGPF
jgi:hypothetical protein